MPRTRLPLGRSLLFSGILMLLVLVVLELMLQLFYFATVGDWLTNRTDLALFEKDETRCYRVKGNLEYDLRTNEFDVKIYTNSQGMRTDSRRRDIEIEKSAGVYRILVLGPSFAFGWGSEYEEGYGALIGELLRDTGLDIEVMNLGTPAQGPEAQLCWLQKEGFRFQPDLILQTTYGRTIPTVVGECPETLSCPFVEDSRLYMTNPTLRKNIIARVKKLGVVFYGFYAYNALLADPSMEKEIEDGKELYSDRARQAFEEGRDAFIGDYHRYQSFVERVVGPETEVVYLFLPLSYLVYPEDASRWSHLADPDPMGARADVIAAAKALRTEGFQLIDTTPDLIANADRERLYYWLDIHLTPAGNRVVAEAAVPTLAKIIKQSIEGSPAARIE